MERRSLAQAYSRSHPYRPCTDVPLCLFGHCRTVLCSSHLKEGYFAMKHNKSIRPGISMVLGMLLCVVLAACGGGGNTSGTNASGSCGSPPKLVKKDHFKIGFLQKARNKPRRPAQTARIKSQAPKRGGKLGYANCPKSGGKQGSHS